MHLALALAQDQAAVDGQVAPFLDLAPRPLDAQVLDALGRSQAEVQLGGDRALVAVRGPHQAAPGDASGSQGHHRPQGARSAVAGPQAHAREVRGRCAVLQQAQVLQAEQSQVQVPVAVEVDGGGAAPVAIEVEAQERGDVDETRRGALDGEE